MTTHWHAPPKPATTSIDLRIEAVVSPSPLWCRRPACAGDTPARTKRPTCRRPLDFDFPPARVISIPIARPAVQVRSFVFPDIKQLPSALWERGRKSRAGGISRQNGVMPASHTRIKPPGDVIKLADRLHYVLQPTLESLLAEGALAFPFRPFPFQFEGVAFLYPRQAAILADEMGLGKTMQAITAMRLLLHRGQVQSVLLVCPKPLVTNWQREFAVWSPETAGDGRRRRSGQTPVAMATARRPAANRQLRIAAARSRVAGRPAFRSGRAR